MSLPAASETAAFIAFLSKVTYPAGVVTLRDASVLEVMSDTELLGSVTVTLSALSAPLTSSVITEALSLTALSTSLVTSDALTEAVASPSLRVAVMFWETVLVASIS